MPRTELVRAAHAFSTLPPRLLIAVGLGRILRKYDAETDEKLPRTHIVFGNYQGDIAWQPGERVVFIGDCAEWSGKLGNEAVEIENVYRSRSTLDPYTVHGEDGLDKMIKTRKLLRKAKGKTSLRLVGCPVSVAEQVQLLVSLGGLKDPTKRWDATKAYLAWKAEMMWKRLAGQPYQVTGDTQRGHAAPDASSVSNAE